MKKIYLSMLLASGSILTQAQVGVNNTDPKATLDVVASTDNKTNDVEGLLIPRVNKEKALKMAGNTALVESTMIYVNDLTLNSTADATIEDITEKGYYFWNGTKWVRTGGSANLNGLWAQRDNNGVQETYLVPADSNNDFIGYQENKDFLFRLGTITTTDFNYENSVNGIGYAPNQIPYATIITSDALPTTTVLGSAKDVFTFNKNISLVREDHASSTSISNDYSGFSSSLVARDVTTNMKGLSSLTASSDLFSNNDVKSVIGVSGITAVGSENDVYNPTVDNNISASFTARNNAISKNMYAVKALTLNNETASSTNLYGIRADVHNYGLADNITGINLVTRTKNTATPHTVKKVNGFFSASVVNEEATVETEFIGLNNRTYIRDNATSPNLHGIVNYIRTYQGANVDDLYGERHIFNTHTDSTIGNMYGLYVDNVNKGTNSNYAIYTNAGNVRIGDLKGTEDSLVLADANGVLKTGSMTDVIGANSKNIYNTDGILTGVRTVDTAGNNLLFTGDGKVGIGTDAPVVKLDVAGVVRSDKAVKIVRSGEDAGPYLELENSDKTELEEGKRWRIYNMGGTYPNSLQFWAYNDTQNLGTKMTLTDKGNLGLGIPSSYEPTHRLELRGGDASLTSKNAPLMLGAYEGANLVLDSNEIMSRNNGDISSLYINSDGGNVHINSAAPEGGFTFREGKLGIGTTAPTEKLEVVGKVKAEAYLGSNGATIWPDYVFEKYYTGDSLIKADYQFNTLDKVEEFVKSNGYLPGYASAKAIAKEGVIDIGATQIINVEKIEELYLHTIAQEKKIEAQQEQINTQQKQIEELKQLVDKLLKD